MGDSLDGVDDLRGWLELAEEFGEVRTITGAHWDKEIGAASEVNYKRPSPPALLFDEIQGYRPGQRVLTASMANARRLGMTLRLGTSLDDRALVEALRTKPKDWVENASALPRPGGRFRPGLRERHLRRRGQPARLPGAEMARRGRRPLHRNRMRGVHDRPDDRRAQRRRLPDAGPERRPRRERQHRSRKTRRRARARMVRQGRARAGHRIPRPRPAAAHRRRHRGADRGLRAGVRRRGHGPPGRRHPRRGHRAADPGDQRVRGRGLAVPGPPRSRRARSASGPATTAAAPRRCSRWTSSASTTATTRSCSVRLPASRRTTTPTCAA